MTFAAGGGTCMEEDDDGDDSDDGMMVMMTSSFSCHPLHLQWLQAAAGVLALGQRAPGAGSDQCRLLLPLRGCLPPVVAGHECDMCLRRTRTRYMCPMWRRSWRSHSLTFQMRSCSLAFNFNDCTNSFDICSRTCVYHSWHL